MNPPHTLPRFHAGKPNTLSWHGLFFFAEAVGIIFSWKNWHGIRNHPEMKRNIIFQVASQVLRAGWKRMDFGGVSLMCLFVFIKCSTSQSTIYIDRIEQLGLYQPYCDLNKSPNLWVHHLSIDFASKSVQDQTRLTFGTTKNHRKKKITQTNLAVSTHPATSKCHFSIQPNKILPGNSAGNLFWDRNSWFVTLSKVVGDLQLKDQVGSH